MLNGFFGRIAIPRALKRELSATCRIRPFIAKGHFRDSFLSIGDRTICSAKIYFEREGAAVRVGSRSVLGRSAILSAQEVIVGDDVLIASNVTISDHDSHSVFWRERRSDTTDWYEGRKNWQHVKIGPVVIEDKVWIGMGAIVLEGVRIGEGSVVGAGSVVTKNVPRYSLVAGNPAKVIRKLDLPD